MTLMDGYLEKKIKATESMADYCTAANCLNV